jgi:hypothetical protein
MSESKRPLSLWPIASQPNAEKICAATQTFGLPGRDED